MNIAQILKQVSAMSETEYDDLIRQIGQLTLHKAIEGRLLPFGLEQELRRALAEDGEPGELAKEIHRQGLANRRPSQ